MTHQPDFRLDGLLPADPVSSAARRGVRVDHLSVMAEHHVPGARSRSFFVLHDASSAQAPPNTPNLRALCVERDPSEGLYTFDTARHASTAFAQRWLVARGCPPDALTLGPEFAQPGDEATPRIEEQIRASGDRYAVLDFRMEERDFTCAAWTLVHDRFAVRLPVRVFLEEDDFNADTYRIGEGAFLNLGRARDWLAHRDRPLPTPSAPLDPTSLRARTALLRSAGGSQANGTPDIRPPASPAPSASPRVSR